MRKPSAWLIGCALSAGFAACAGAPAPASVEPVAPVAPVASSTSAPPISTSDSPTKSDVPPAPESATAPTASRDVSPSPESSGPAAAAESPAETSRPSRSPIDILTGADTAFLIDYASSAPIEVARRSCAEKSADDPEAQAKCLSDAREAFKADVIRFRKDGAHWSWTVYKRSGSRLDEVASSRLDLSEASPNSVKVKFLGDKGMRPLLKNKREAVLTVPNDYSFEIDDAEWGKLEYEAKIGLVAN